MAENPNKNKPGAAAGAKAPEENTGKAPEAGATQGEQAPSPQTSQAPPPPKKEDEEENVREAVVAGPRQVKIQAIVDHETNIGGTPYNLKRGNDYKVPEDVAMILQHAQIAIRK